ncbi:MAG: XdhC family protein [Eubacteriales bacterium]
MKKIIEAILNKITDKTVGENSECIVVSVVSSTGSTPRKSGATMLVDKTGVLEGTIGGGLLEYTCTEQALLMLQSLEKTDVKETIPTTKEFVLDNEKAGALGMVCGGNTKILYFPLLHSSGLQDVMEEALCCIEENQEADLCLGVSENLVKVLKKREQENVDLQAHIKLPLTSAHRIILVGGGHVALEVAKLLTYLGFRYVIIDDRAEFAAHARFPEAEEVIVASEEQYEERLSCVGPIGNKDGFCIMTRGHKGDTEAVRYALSTQASYLGVMGSKVKRKKVFAQLESEGYTGIRERVITPIGLDIGAETPEELAISIVGQLIQWRAGRM